MRTSKYLHKTFDGWTVTAVGIATVQSARAKSPYHRGYYYLLERMTSDGKCIKQVRLNAAYMCQLARGQLLGGKRTIEEFADKHAHSKKATCKTNYSFLE